MNLTLLLDLDDTLLQNSMDSFLPAYLQAWARFVSPHTDPQKFVSNMLSATHYMVENQLPDCTLQDVFNSVFFPAVGIDVNQFQPFQDQFYKELFPNLQNLTNPVPGAVEFVEEALDRGYEIAIATNPLFPLTAIQQRLAWAGLPVEKYPFLLIPSYETFHFAKPNPAYFSELLAQLGWPEGPVVMVGDDLKMDVLCGRQSGLPVFQSIPDGATPPDNLDLPWSCGVLSDLLTWLDHTPLDSLHPNLNLPSAVMATLRSTPAVFDSLARQMDGDDWKKSPRLDEWCSIEVACHLRDVDMEINLPRLRRVLQEYNPFIPGVDSDLWAEERDYIHQDGPQAFQVFTTARMELLNLLEEASLTDWQRTARHAIFGPTNLSELVRIVAGHDRLHVRQIQRNLDDWN